MDKSTAIFRIIAVAGLITGVAALIRRESEIKVLNDTHYLIRQYVDDKRFANITDRYNEDGD